MRLYYKDIKNLLKESYLSSGRDYFNKGKVRNVSINKFHAKSEVVGSSVGMFKKVCQTIFSVQLNFQSIRKENIKLRDS